mmetsp:Transcript_51484/g.112073  ORF Transcript_51484/g.112073 Transcript_51484/m.112073 type:complete len:105 (-) Transcript_51484:176-490(-)
MAKYLSGLLMACQVAVDMDSIMLTQTKQAAELRLLLHVSVVTEHCKAGRARHCQLFGHNSATWSRGQQTSMLLQCLLDFVVHRSPCALATSAALLRHLLAVCNA